MGSCTVYLWDFEIEGLLEGLTPDLLTRTSRLWEQDIIACGPWEQVTEEKIARTIGGRTWHALNSRGDSTVLVCGPCSSSMDVAWELVHREFLNLWDSVLAVEQNAGRGQHNRIWRSPPGNIYASWRWPAPPGLTRIHKKWPGLIPLLAGHIIAEGLKKKGIPVHIKWPNDLLLNDRKVGGILIENRAGSVLVGLGLNVENSPQGKILEDELATPPTDLVREGFSVTPLDLWCTLSAAGKAAFDLWTRTKTPGEFLGRLKESIAWMGKPVLVELSPGEVIPATISGLSEEGGLTLNTGGANTVIYSGRIAAQE